MFHVLLINIATESINQIFIIDETRNYSLKEIKQNILMSKKHKKVCMTLNFMEILLILLPAISGFLSISAYALLLDIPIGVSSYVVVLKIRAIAPRIKRNKSTIKKKRQKHDKIVLLAKTKLNTAEGLISKVSIDL